MTDSPPSVSGPSSAEAASDGVVLEQIRVLFRQTPIIVAVNGINAVLTAAVLLPVASGMRIALWLALFTVLLVVRWDLWQRYRRGAEPRPSAAMAVVHSALSGMLWGVGSAVLLPAQLPQRVFIVLVVAGMCAGSVAVLSTYLPAVVAFLVCATLPLAARFALDGAPTDLVLAGMIIVFTVALSAAALTLNRSLADAVRLRLDLAQRSKELDAANASLRQEIEARHGAEAALQQAQKMEAMGQLTGGLAHDFNNVLTAIIGNLELAIGSLSRAERLPGLLRGALQAAERGTSLTQRLLAFARRQRLRPQAVELPALIAGIEGLLRRTLGPAIRLEVEATADLAPAQVDAHQLELAILNLAINARDAMPEGGKLRITMAGRRANGTTPIDLPAGDYVVVAVADTGIGMEAAVLARVFEPFFTTKEAGKGSGLGLPMVKSFATQSGGAIEIGSAPGQGTTVEIWLPRAAAAAATATAAPTVPPASAGIRVLLCDDDDAVRHSLAAGLRAHGCIVHEAASAAAALHVLASDLEIDVLVVDYAMPDMTGSAVAETALRWRPSLKRLLISGAPGAPHETLNGLRLLAKPFRPADLARAVAALCGAAGVQQEPGGGQDRSTA